MAKLRAKSKKSGNLSMSRSKMSMSRSMSKFSHSISIIELPARGDSNAGPETNGNEDSEEDEE